jgi:hypothetical protein
MIRLVLWLIITLLTAGCAQSFKYGMTKLPDGSELQAVQYESIRLIGTDLSYLVLYRCVNVGEAGATCAKVGEAAGSTETVVENVLHGGGASVAVAFTPSDELTITQSGASSAGADAQAISTSQSQSSAASKAKNDTDDKKPKKKKHKKYDDHGH